MLESTRNLFNHLLRIASLVSIIGKNERGDFPSKEGEGKNEIDGGGLCAVCWWRWRVHLLID